VYNTKLNSHNRNTPNVSINQRRLRKHVSLNEKLYKLRNFWATLTRYSTIITTLNLFLTCHSTYSGMNKHAVCTRQQ